MDNQAVTSASSYFDLQGLDSLRQKAKGNDKDSIREVANQFESMFATMLIKSMRDANAAFETDSPFNNSHTKFYQDMQDKQLAIDISRHGALGLGDALVRQLDPSSIIKPKQLPGSELNMGRSDAQMIDIVKAKVNSEDFNAPLKATPRKKTEKVEDLPKFNDQGSFIDTLLPYAKKVAKALGISPAVLIAQSALETGWGKKVINLVNNKSSFNLFNIKANKKWSGDIVSKNSLEVENGIGIKRISNFRAYQNIEHSFSDYSNFISKNDRYKEALSCGTDANRYIEKLQEAGYATDPQYANKIKKIMQSTEFKNALARGAS